MNCNVNEKCKPTQISNRSHVTNDQLQPFYNSILELLKLIQSPRGYGSQGSGYLFNIDTNAIKLASALKTHIENFNIHDIIFSNEFKFKLPLFTGAEYEELKRWASMSNNKQLSKKISDYEAVFDFSKELEEGDGG